MHTLTINGTDLSTYGIFLGSDTYLDAPLIDYTAYDIPAKNGSVIQYNKRLNNVIRRFDCYIPESQNVQAAMDKLKRLLYLNIGYLNLVTDYEPNYYQEGYLAQDIQAIPFNIGQSATFSLYFSCKPQKYYVTQDTITVGNVAPSYSFSPLRREDAIIQSLFSKLDIEMISNADMYLFIARSNQDYTDFDVSWTEGDTFIYLVEMENSQIINVFAATNTSIVDAVASCTSPTSNVLVIIPYHNTGTMTLHYSYGGNNYTLNADLSVDTQAKTQASAVGYQIESLSMKVPVPPTVYSTANTGVVIQSFVDTVQNDLLWLRYKASFYLILDKLDTEGYSTDGYVTLSADLTNKRVYAVKTGLPDFDITNYFQIYGGYGYGNKIVMQNVARGSYWFPEEATAYIRWWKL